MSGKTQKGVQVAQVTGTAQRGDYTVTVRLRFWLLGSCWAAGGRCAACWPAGVQCELVLPGLG